MMNKILVSLLVLLGSMPAVQAANLGDLQVRELAKVATAKYIDYNDSTLINIDYVGTSTGATVNISSGLIALAVPYGTAYTSWNISEAAYDTIGEICDAIDADDDFACKLTGGKRDDASNLLKDVTATAAGTGDTAVNGGLDLILSTGSFNASPTNTTDPYKMRIGITPSTGKRVVLRYCTVNLNSSTHDLDGLIVYGKLQKYATATDGVTRNDTTKVIGGVHVDDDTSTEVGNIYGGDWLEFAQDAHVVISAGSGTSTQAAGNTLTCLWYEK